MENNKKNDIMLQPSTSIVNEKIDFIKKINELKNNKIVQLAVSSVVFLLKRRKNESKTK